MTSAAARASCAAASAASRSRRAAAARAATVSAARRPRLETARVSPPSSRVKTYSALCTPEARVSPAHRSTPNPNEAHTSATCAAGMPPTPPPSPPSRRAVSIGGAAPSASATAFRSQTATRPSLFSARLARASNARSIAAGVSTRPLPDAETAAERTPYGKSVTIASTAFSSGPYAAETAGSSRSDASAKEIDVARARRRQTSSSSEPSSPSSRGAIPARKKRLAASLAASSTCASTSQPSTRSAPSSAAAKAMAPPPTHGSTTKSPGLTRAAFAASVACSGGAAFGASIARRRALESMPHAAISPKMPSGTT